VLFVSLASVPSPDQLVFTLVNSLDLPTAGTATPATLLLDYLREKELLLVLDNFEHLLDGVDLLLEILAQAGSVKALITSRERLNLQEEWVYSLHGLPFPEESDPDWQENSSVALFLQMARKTRSDFTLSEADRPAMMQICRLLGGMPLGLQLAASWVRVLSPAEIAQEIEQNLEFLTVSHRNVPERHRSLRAVFDHSWQLLSPAEQKLFGTLSVFQGSFSREAAEYVAGATLMGLTSLLDKSLVRPHGGGRYSLLELLRQYAALKLSAQGDERCALQHRHSRYYMDFLHAQEDRLYTPDQITILDAIATDLDNVRAAWRWAADGGDEEGLRRGLHSLTFFYFRRSRYSEAVPLIGYAIERQRRRPQSAASQSLLGRLLSRQGNFLHGLGRYDEAIAAFEESLSLLRAYEETPLELALALRSFGHLLDDTGDYSRARQFLEEALALARQEGNTFGVAVALSYLCSHYWRLNHFDQARATIEESIALYRQIGDIWGLAHALTNLANSYQTPAESHLAIDIFHESLALYRSLNNLSGMAQALNSLGYTSMILGEYKQAREAFAESLKLQRQQGGSLSIARVLNNQGQVAYLLGDYEEALKLSRESLAIRRASGAAREVAFSLYTIGLILMDQGDVDSAASHWREALALFERLGQPQKVANCLNELGNVAIQRGEWDQAADLLDRGLTIAQEMKAPWTEARARLFLGILARARGDVCGAMASLRTGLQIAIGAEELVLALDILLEMAAVDATPGLSPWLAEALCLMQHHPQCRPQTRQRARALLIARSRNPDAADCSAVRQGELSTRLVEIVALANTAVHLTT
jgi:predicted ATPase/Tfp pilus assembly protein PilF